MSCEEPEQIFTATQELLTVFCPPESDRGVLASQKGDIMLADVGRLANVRVLFKVMSSPGCCAGCCPSDFVCQWVVSGCCQGAVQ